MEEATKYYEWLFSTKDCEDAAAQQLYHELAKKTLCKQDSEVCEGDISKAEVFAVMRNLPRGKAPGPDGVPNEYYKTFAKMECGLLAEYYNEVHMPKEKQAKTSKAGSLAYYTRKRIVGIYETTDP